MGKFSSRTAERYYNRSQDGAHEEAGDCQSNGTWYGKFPRAILTEDSQGFVDVETFSSTAKCNAAWAEILASLEEYEEGCE